MLININSGSFHNRPKKFWRFFRILQLRTRKITVSALTSVIFHGSFWNMARTFIALIHMYLGQVRLWRFYLIKYAHNGPFNEPASFRIPGLIFQTKVTKFGTKVGLKMLINIHSGLFHNRQKKIWRFFFAFCNFAHRKSPLVLSRP